MCMKECFIIIFFVYFIFIKREYRAEPHHGHIVASCCIAKNTNSILCMKLKLDISLGSWDCTVGSVLGGLASTTRITLQNKKTFLFCIEPKVAATITCFCTVKLARVNFIAQHFYVKKKDRLFIRPFLGFT